MSKLQTSQAEDISVIILILTGKDRLNTYEVISIQQCFNIFSGHTIKIVCPENLDISQYLKINSEAEFDCVPTYWFSSYMNHNLLKAMPFLYKRYRKYDYILFYELGSFVWKDQLMEWCSKGFSYVSTYSYSNTQHLQSVHTANLDSSFLNVGSGAFSLRRTSDFLKALSSFSYVERPIELWKKFRDVSLPRKPYFFFDMIERLTIRNNTHPWFNDWIGIREENMFWLRQDDVFWSSIISRNFQWFTIPDPLEAIQFGFDNGAQFLYDLNNHVLPFGCHGWSQQNLDFWRPFICNYGYNI